MLHTVCIEYCTDELYCPSVLFAIAAENNGGVRQFCERIGQSDQDIAASGHVSLRQKLVVDVRVVPLSFRA